MGTWGAGLYADDTACEVRDEFRTQLASGVGPSVAEDQLLSRFESLLGDDQIACLVYFALADTQWKLGCLSKRVREHATRLLASGGDLRYWAEDAPGDVRARTRTLNALRERLDSPQPPWKQPPQKKERARRRQLDLPIGAVLRLSLPGDHFALLKLVGFLPVGTVDTALFRVLPWRSRQQPTRDELNTISEQSVQVEGHHEFSVLLDGRKKLTSFLQPTEIVLESATPIDMGQWRALGTEILPARVKEALALNSRAP
jgi:hypothetical protein